MSNLEARRAYNRQWRKRNKAHVSAYNRAWKKDNKKHIRKYRKKYHKEHKEHLNAQSRAWYKNNKKRAEINNRAWRTPTWKSWRHMIARCNDPNDIRFSVYGGRGIKVCKRWRSSFKNFLADMGERPKGKTLDRYPDQNGDYKPTNCRWATPKQQANNRRRSKKRSASVP